MLYRAVWADSLSMQYSLYGSAVLF